MEYKNETSEAMAEHRRERMRLNFLKKIEDVAQGRSKNIWQQSKPGSQPVKAKHEEQTATRKIKRDVFRKLVTRKIED